MFKLSSEKLNELVEAKRKRDQQVKDGTLPPTQRVPEYDQLTVVEKMYFHPVGRSVVAAETTWTKQLGSSGGKVLEYEGVAGAEWQPLIPVPLQALWPEHVARLIIVNHEGYFPVTKPGKEEVADSDRRVLDVVLKAPEWDYGNPIQVFPREDARFRPKQWQQLYLRCAYKTAKYIVVGVPA